MISKKHHSLQEMNSGFHKDTSISWKEFLLMFFLLAISGNPFFYQNLPVIVSIAFVIPLYYILKNTSGFITYKTLFIFVFFIGYELLHSLIFNLDYSLTLIKQFLVLLLAYTIVHLLKDRFIHVFIRTIYILSIISLIFVLLCYIPGVTSFLYNLAAKLFPLKTDFNNFSTPTLLLFTFHPDMLSNESSYIRNAGMFWEAGAFAVFLNITLYFYYTKKKINSISDLFDKNSIIFIIALLSTASTMGFLALTIILSFFTFQLKTNLKYILFTLIGIAFITAFYQIDYLGEKITDQLAASSTSNNRFGSALLDFEDIKEKPVLGWSRRIEVLFGTTEFNAETHRPNGLTNFIRNYGFLYFVVYFYFVCGSFRNISFQHGISNTKAISVALFGVLLLFIVSFSELIFDLAFFKSLIFLSLVYVPTRGHFYSNGLRIEGKEISQQLSF